MGSPAQNARYYATNRERIILQRKHRRRANVAAAILEDARRADRKHKRQNDLDLPFVEAQIAKPCGYCGDTALRKTLDRVDNTQGHTKTNVLVACERCNYVRRDMPSEAWAIVAKAMRIARERGLFGTWTCGIHRRVALAPLPLPAARGPAPHGTLTRYHTCGPPRCAACRQAMRDWKRDRRRILGS